MKYQFIQNNRSEFTVKKMCLILSASESGYYRWIEAPISKMSLANEILKERIEELFDEHNGMAGSPMITADLKIEPEFSGVGKNRVAKLMKENGLRAHAKITSQNWRSGLG